ncbi:MAG: hypothetical protein AB8F78_09660 [Saprospiraceae bacterium]
MKKLLFLLFAGILLSSVSLTAQNFESAVGARLGIPLSVSYKLFINESDAVEAYAGISSRAFYNEARVAVAYQRHNSFDLDAELAPLQWYYGAGASVGFYNYALDYIGNSGGIGLGISGYLGVQYAFDDIPLEVTVDWVPTIGIGSNGGRGFAAGYAGAGIRYILRR